MLVCFINMIINANKSYYDKGNLVMERPKILIEFFKTHFHYDMIAILVMSYNYHEAPTFH